MKTPDIVTFMTHYPGLATNHSEMCGGPLLFVAENQTKQSFQLNITSSNYSCEYRVNVANLKFRDEGDILIWLEEISRVRVYIYSGTDHRNLTSLIESDSTAAVGAPYRIKLKNGGVIIAHAVVDPV